MERKNKISGKEQCEVFSFSFWKKLVLLFTKNTENWSKVSFTMLQKISISNQHCFIDFLFKKNMSSIKILSSTTVFNIDVYNYCHSYDNILILTYTHRTKSFYNIYEFVSCLRITWPVKWDSVFVCICPSVICYSVIGYYIFIYFIIVIIFFFFS